MEIVKANSQSSDQWSPAEHGASSCIREPSRSRGVLGDAGTAHFELIGGVLVTDWSPQTLIRNCEERLSQGQPVHICTVNPEISEMALADRDYGRIVQHADIATIDGIGISLAVLRQHSRFPRRLTGVTLVNALTDWARETNREIGIVGASDTSRRRAESRLRAIGLRVRDGVSPTVTLRGESEPLPREWWPVSGIVLVALGPPKQEFWIRKQIEGGAPPNVFVGIGGAVDYLSGVAKPPPALVKRLGVEWLYRLLREPQKRLRRQVATLPRFAWRQVLWGR